MVIIGKLQVFHIYVDVLFDHGAKLSFVTPYIEVNFGVSPEILSKPFTISTLVGDVVIAKWVYKNYVVTIFQKATLVDIAQVDLVDFDVILGMNWLDIFYASINCRMRVVQFQFPNKPILE